MWTFAQVIGTFIFFLVIFPRIFLVLFGTNEQKKSMKGSGFAYFIFGEDRGVNQPDADPFLNSDYDNGPDW